MLPGVRFGSGNAFHGVDQLVMLMLIYGAGFAQIFLLFAAMYWRAARRVTDPARRHEARVLLGHSLVYVGVAALSMALAVFGGAVGTPFSGVAYAMIGPCQGLYHGLTRRYWKPPLPSAAIPPADDAPATDAPGLS